MAKNNYATRTKLIHSHKLYIWSDTQIKALNYFLHHKPLMPALEWEATGKITLVTRDNVNIKAHAAAIINKYKLSSQYYICQLMFKDTAIQIWLTDAQLEPICNITSWAE